MVTKKPSSAATITDQQLDRGASVEIGCSVRPQSAAASPAPLWFVFLLHRETIAHDGAVIYRGNLLQYIKRKTAVGIVLGNQAWAVADTLVNR